MPTHGNARKMTIAALSNRAAFKRSGFAMSAIEGPSDSLGIMEGEAREMYLRHRDANEIVYTVKSYATPILWVLKDGSVINPKVGYSNTTKNHLSLASLYVK